MVLIVPLRIQAMTVIATWLESTAVKGDAQNDIKKFVNSGIAEKDALEEALVNISMKTLQHTIVKEKCDACKFDCYDQDQVIAHTIRTHKFKLCRQCDDTIEKKEALLSKTFDLRNILKIKYPDMSSKVLYSLVKY